MQASLVTLSTFVSAFYYSPTFLGGQLSLLPILSSSARGQPGEAESQKHGSLPRGWTVLQVSMGGVARTHTAAPLSPFYMKGWICCWCFLRRNFPFLAGSKPCPRAVDSFSKAFFSVRGAYFLFLFSSDRQKSGPTRAQDVDQRRVCQVLSLPGRGSVRV